MSTVGAMTVTATALQNGTLTATGTVNVQPPNLQSITIADGTPNVTTVGVGGTLPFTASGLSGGNTFDLTQIVTWNSSNTQVATIAAGGLLTASGTAAPGQTTVITATLEGITSNQITITITQ
jgi:hypothetical protein